MGHKTGIDLGGTKTEILVLGPELEPVYRKRVTTPAHDYDEILQSIANLVAQAEAELGVASSIGIGIPGAISPNSGLLRNSNTLCLNGRPFARDLAALLQREVRIENDANCFALSEALSPRTPVSGLFFSGQDAVSPGIAGALWGGMLCAAAIDPLVFRKLG